MKPTPLPSLGRWLASFTPRRPASPIRLEVSQDEPLVARSAHCALLFDGDLYDWDELRLRIGADKTRGRGDLLLDAHMRFGPRLLNHLKGEFALLIWDQRSNVFSCVRDPTGIKPVFYSRTEDGILVSPILELMLAQPGVSSQVDPVVAARHVLDLSQLAEETFFPSVKRLPPGHALRLSHDDLETSRYWHPRDNSDPESLAPAEALETLEWLLRRSIKRSLKQFSPGAVFLSGGIDSATVAALATEVSHELGTRRPLALSLVIPDPSAAEEGTQRAVARGLGVDQILMRVDDVVPAGELLRSVLKLAESGSPAPPGLLQPAYDALGRLGVQKGCDVIFTGEGGDEWLAPHPSYAADRLRAFDALSLFRLWRAWSGYYPQEPNSSIMGGLLWKWGMRTLLRSAIGRFLTVHRPERLKDYRRKRLLAGLPPWLLPDLALREALIDRIVEGSTEVRPGDLYRTQKKQLLEHPNLSVTMEDVRAMSDRVGVALGLPLFDSDVVAFLYGLPERLLIRRGKMKALARDLLAQRLPGLVRVWPRTVFGDSFFTATIMNEIEAAWQTVGQARLLADLGVIDPKKANSSVPWSTSEAERIWGATNLDIWLRSLIIRKRL